METKIYNVASGLTEAEVLVALMATIAGDRFDLLDKDIWVYPYVMGSNDVAIKLKRKGFLSKVGHAGMHDAYRITDLGKIVITEIVGRAPNFKDFINKAAVVGVGAVLASLDVLVKKELSDYAKRNPREIDNTWDEVVK